MATNVMATDVMAPVRKFYQVYNEQNLSLWNDAIAEDYVGNVNGQVVPNRETGVGFVSALLKAFPNIHYALEDTITSGNKVVTRWKATGTHDGDLFGMPPTHKNVTMIGITIFEVKNGKVAALWDVWDQAGMMAQLNG
jgi:steroid delta-isomerase-like uncharacterized protein